MGFFLVFFNLNIYLFTHYLFIYLFISFFFFLNALNTLLINSYISTRNMFMRREKKKKKKKTQHKHVPLMGIDLMMTSYQANCTTGLHLIPVKKQRSPASCQW